MKHHCSVVKDFLDEIIIPESFLTKFSVEEKQELEKEIQLVGSYFIDYTRYEFNDEISGWIQDGTLKCNFNAIGIFLDSFYKYYSKILTLVDKFIAADPKNYRTILREIIFNQSMVKNNYHFLYNAMISNEDEIYYIDQDSETWKQFSEHVEEIDLYEDDPKLAITNYSKLCEWIITAETTMSSHEVEEQSTIKRFFKSGTNALKFFVNKATRMKQYMTFLANPNLDTAINLWNIFDSEYVVGAIETRLHSVETNMILHIPKLFEKITIDTIKDLNTEESYERIEEFKAYPRQIDCYEKTWENKRDTDFYLNIHDEPDRFVKVRLLAHNFTPFDFTTMKWRPVNVEGFDESQQELKDLIQNDLNVQIENFVKNEAQAPAPVAPVTKIIIHIHGGNFVSMSSGSHQSYTRAWTRFLNIPVFSIDYRLAPDNKYPDPIDDVWQAYLWIVKFSYMHLGITPEKIILVGDSSGANLCNAIVMLAIQKNFRIPDELILCYPNACLDKSFVYPSLLYSLIDPFLNINFIKMFNDAYLIEDSDP